MFLQAFLVWKRGLACSRKAKVVTFRGQSAREKKKTYPSSAAGAYAPCGQLGTRLAPCRSIFREGECRRTAKPKMEKMGRPMKLPRNSEILIETGEKGLKMSWGERKSYSPSQ